MRQLRCWICGKQISQSTISQVEPFYLETRIVQVNRPYGLNSKTKPIFICGDCALIKVGVTTEGRNLNKR